MIAESIPVTVCFIYKQAEYSLLALSRFTLRSTHMNGVLQKSNI